MPSESTIGHRSIHGACHCGNIRFELQWPASIRDIAVRRCGCTFCQKHGGVWTSHRGSSLAIAIEDRTQVSRYRFGTKTADFHVCARCGAVPFVLSEIDGGRYAVVNVNTFEETGGLTFSATATDFDGEATPDRLARRKRNWIPLVQINASGAG